MARGSAAIPWTPPGLSAMNRSDLPMLLESNREALHRLPGVIGSGIGMAAAERSGGEAIHLYVIPETDIEAVRREATGLLDGGGPLEVIAMEPPEADGE